VAQVDQDANQLLATFRVGVEAYAEEVLPPGTMSSLSIARTAHHQCDLAVPAVIDRYRTAYFGHEGTPEIDVTDDIVCDVGQLSATPALVEAKRKVRLCEAALGNTLATVRGVALFDKTFSAIAMERYGSRRQNWLVDENRDLRLPDGSPDPDGGWIEEDVPNALGLPTKGKLPLKTVFRERLVPKSGRHREAIRQEFVAGLRQLTAAVRTLITTPGVEELWVQPGAAGLNSPATIQRGVAAPNDAYRVWGDSARVDAVQAELTGRYGVDLAFPTAAAAKAALEAAEAGRLIRLDEDDASA
jgi:hypothetical protein